MFTYPQPVNRQQKKKLTAEVEPVIEFVSRLESHFSGATTKKKNIDLILNYLNSIVQYGFPIAKIQKLNTYN